MGFFKSKPAEPRDGRLAELLVFDGDEGTRQYALKQVAAAEAVIDTIKEDQEVVRVVVDSELNLFVLTDRAVMAVDGDDVGARMGYGEIGSLVITPAGDRFGLNGLEIFAPGAEEKMAAYNDAIASGGREMRGAVRQGSGVEPNEFLLMTFQDPGLCHQVHDEIEQRRASRS